MAMYIDAYGHVLFLVTILFSAAVGTTVSMTIEPQDAKVHVLKSSRARPLMRRERKGVPASSSMTSISPKGEILTSMISEPSDLHDRHTSEQNQPKFLPKAHETSSHAFAEVRHHPHSALIGNTFEMDALVGDKTQSEAYREAIARKMSIDFDRPRKGSTANGKFIGGKYIELGFRTNDEIGKMGVSDSVPSNFNGRGKKSGVGMTGNAKGFAADKSNSATIDYVLPGTPEEGFFLGYKSGGNVTTCKNCGRHVAVRTHGTNAIATIRSKIGNLAVDQQITLGVNDTFFRNDVRLKNVGKTALNDVRFMRSHNPDNTVDHEGSFSTHIVREACLACPTGASAVSAASLPNDGYFTKNGGTAATVMYYSKDSHAIAAWGTSASPTSIYDANVWDTPPALNDPRSSDTYISICFKYDTLESGRSRHFTYYTALDNTRVQDTLDKVIAADSRVGFCAVYQCPVGMVHKADLRVSCEGKSCTDSECCEPVGRCSAMNCSIEGHGLYYMRQDAAAVPCKGAACGRVDMATCCDASCDTFDADACPTNRTSNPCVLYDADCELKCEVHSAKHCPVGDIDPCLVVDGACKSKDFCTEHFACPEGKALKSHFEPFCASTTCSPSDCCGSPGACPTSASRSICGADLEPILSGVTCSKDECTEEECCRAAGGLLDAQRSDEIMHDSGVDARNQWHAEQESIPAKADESILQERKSEINFDVPRKGSSNKGVFIGGKYIELGFRTNNQVGKMGTDDCPGNFNGRSGRSGVGMTANSHGFGSGNSVTIDYFLPGCPEEGFYVGYKKGGQAHTCKNCADGVTTEIEGEEARALTTARTGDVQVDQTISLIVNNAFFRNDVRIVNKGDAPIQNVRFMRSHDPDNTVDQSGSYVTHQKIEQCSGCPDGAKAVTAASKAHDTYYGSAGSKEARVIYYTKDERGRVSFGNSGLAPSGIYTSRVYDSVPSKGDTTTRDAYISICFEVPSLAKDEAAEFTFWTSLGDSPTGRTLGAIIDADTPLGLCEDYTCSDPGVWIPKTRLPVSCLAPDCTDTECCDQRAFCTEMDCPALGSYTIKPHAETVRCAGKECSANVDTDTCCDPNCDTYTEDTCPTDRAFPNRCAIYNSNCALACESFTHLGSGCPVAAAERCVLEGASCVPKGKCTADFDCGIFKVLKSTFEPYCAGTTCSSEDCCGDAAACPMDEANTICTAPLHLMKVAKTCRSTECTEMECCHTTTTTTTTAMAKVTGASGGGVDWYEPRQVQDFCTISPGEGTHILMNLPSYMGNGYLVSPHVLADGVDKWPGMNGHPWDWTINFVKPVTLYIWIWAAGQTPDYSGGLPAILMADNWSTTPTVSFKRSGDQYGTNANTLEVWTKSFNISNTEGKTEADQVVISNIQGRLMAGVVSKPL